MFPVRHLAATLLILGGALAPTSTLSQSLARDPDLVMPIWPEKPPGDAQTLPPEQDTSKANDRSVAGKPVVRIGNVSTPTLAIYRPAKEKDTGAAVVICPGGGHRILAYDLEGTEVAEWLNTIGITGIVLKYRVPAREGGPRFRAAVQDAQRAVSLVRAKAKDWGIDPNRIGLLGFSAGGDTAGRATLLTDRQYSAVDAIDDAPFRPDFTILIYPAYLVTNDNTRLMDDVKVNSKTPPMFLVHAYDDGVRPENSVLLFLELKKAGVPAELHVYSKGGHGYGLRPTDDAVTTWPARCEAWLRASGTLKPTTSTP